MRTGLLLVGWYALAVGAGSAAGAQDAQVAGRVRDAIASYVHFTIFDDVAVIVETGVVRLDGRVTMPFKRDAIEKRVRAVEGVREIANGIEVLPLLGTDIELRRSIASAIYGHPAFWPYASMARPPIHIVVERGHVRLTGVVSSRVERQLAFALAQVPGAFGVKNEITVERTDG